MSTFAIIPSGGRGLRSGEPSPKQYLKFNGKELIVYTLEIFQNSPHIDKIIIAAQPEYFELLNDLKKKYKLSKLSSIVKSGATRQDSVFNALKSITASENDLIAVHDAVRPMLPKKILERSLNFAEKYDNVVTAIKAKDTLIEGTEIVANYLDRDNIYYVQTPQIFRYKILFDAMLKAKDENFMGTDESMLVQRASYKVKIVEGSSINLKITTPSDIQLFRIFSKNLKEFLSY